MEVCGMWRPYVAVSALVLAVCLAPVQAQQTQQKSPEPSRSTASFDAAAVRRQAAQMAELRTLLADPDPNVRLLTLREAIRTGDTLQRQVAIEAALASSESAMVEIGLRGVLANVQQLIIGLTDAEGTVPQNGSAQLLMSVAQFDMESGRINGAMSCGGDKWSGQLQGNIFSFAMPNGACSGTLSWNSESQDFRGLVNLNSGQAAYNRNGIWKPR
jgi:hypothetical protein